MSLLIQGTVSKATHRPIDLAAAFWPLLRPFHYKKYDDWLPEELSRNNTMFWRDELCGEIDPEMIEEMFNDLDALAPPGYYFGAHPGDGSDFGFWRIEKE